MQIISRNQLLNLKHLAAPCGAVNKILSELMCYFAPTNVYVYSIKKHEILLSLSPPQLHSPLLSLHFTLNNFFVHHFGFIITIT